MSPDELPDDPGSRLERLLEQQGLGGADDPAGPARPETPGEPGGGADDALHHALSQLDDDRDEAPADAGAPATGGAEPGADTADAGPSLPDAPLFALLRSLEAEVGVDRIDRIWVFPPRRLEAGETAVVVVAAYPELDEDRRRVYAAHYTAPAEAREPRLAVLEYGTAPTDRVGRLVEDVVERLKDQPAAPPHAYPVGGDDARWHAALHDLAEKHLEEAEKNPRLRR